MVMFRKDEITVSTRMEKQDYKRFLLENAYKISTVSTLVGRAALALISSRCWCATHCIRPLA